MLADEPLEKFVNYYVSELENLVEISHQFQSGEVLGSPGIMDELPEAKLEMERLRNRREAIGNDLLENRKENQTWVNSVMAYLHG